MLWAYQQVCAGSGVHARQRAAGSGAALCLPLLRVCDYCIRIQYRCSRACAISILTHFILQTLSDGLRATHAQFENNMVAALAQGLNDPWCQVQFYLH
jgi:hypothetical protein